MEEDEPLYVPVAMPDSCEFRGQRVHKVVTDSPVRRVIMPHGHDRQRSPSRLPVILGFDPPTEVCSIVGFHLVFVHLLDPSVLPHGYVTGQIPHGPLAILCRYLLLRSRYFLRPRLS